MSLLRLTEIVPDFIFTDGDEVAECCGAAFVFQYFYSIQVVFDMVIGVNDDPAGIPLSDGMNKTFLFVGRNEIV